MINLRTLRFIANKLDSILLALLSLFFISVLIFIVSWINQRPDELLTLTINEVESRTYYQPIIIKNSDRVEARLNDLLIYDAGINYNSSHTLEVNDQQINFTVQIYQNFNLPIIVSSILLTSLTSLVLVFRRWFLK